MHIHVYTTCMCTGLGTCVLTQTHPHTHAHAYMPTHSNTHTQDNPMVDKRAHHNALERRRRDHIKDSFHDLRDCIPSLQGEKVDTFPSSPVSVFLSSPSCPPPSCLPLLPSCFTFLPTYFPYLLHVDRPFRPSFSPPSSSSSSHSSPSPHPPSPPLSSSTYDLLSLILLLILARSLHIPICH